MRNRCFATGFGTIIWVLVALFWLSGWVVAAYPLATYPVDAVWSSFPHNPPDTSVEVVIHIGPNVPQSNNCMTPYASSCILAMDRTITSADVGKSFTIDSTSANFYQLVTALSFPSGFAFGRRTGNSLFGFGEGGFTSGVGLRGEITSLVLTVNHYCSSPPLGCVDRQGDYWDTAVLMDFTILALPSTLAIPHFAAGGTWATGFLVINTGTTAAQFVVNFFDDGGHQVALPFDTGPTAIASGTIPGLGSVYFETSGTATAAVSGWGMVIADPTIVVQSVFRNSANGTYYEAAVPASAGGTEFLIPFDATTFAGTSSPFYTGFAIANMSESYRASVSCTARESSGKVIPDAIVVPELSPLGHWANYLFPLLTGKRGMIDCKSNTNIAAIALRVIGNSAFTSLPVIGK